MGLEGLTGFASVAQSGLGIAKAVLPIVSGVGETAQAVAYGRQEQEAQEYNAQIAELESGLALRSAARSDLNATIARNAAGIEVSRTLEAGRKVQGTQAAMAAHAGLVVTEGSPLLAQLETIRRSQEDAVIARWKGYVTATGFEAEAEQKRIQSQALQAEAQMRRRLGRQRLLTGITRATGAAARTAENLSNFRWPVTAPETVPEYRGGYD